MARAPRPAEPLTSEEWIHIAAAGEAAGSRTGASVAALAAESAGHTYSSGHGRKARPPRQASWTCGTTADMSFAAQLWPSCLFDLVASR